MPNQRVVALYTWPQRFSIPVWFCGWHHLPLAQPASSASSSVMAKWVKQSSALQGTQPTNEISNAASHVRDQTLVGTHSSSAGVPWLCCQLD
jgi:hypothetical protein